MIFVRLLIMLAVVSVSGESQTVLQQNYDSRSYNWSRVNESSASGDLGTSGVGKVITLKNCPHGLAIGGTVGISGGSGTAETAAPVTAVACTGGAASGTITVTTTNAHSGKWTVSSGSKGQSEAVSMASAAGSTAFMYGATGTPSQSVTWRQYWRSGSGDGSAYIAGIYPDPAPVHVGHLFSSTSEAASFDSQHFGIASYARTNRASGSAVGLWALGHAAANNSLGMAMNPICTVKSGITGASCIGLEIDIEPEQPFGTAIPGSAKGVDIVGYNERLPGMAIDIRSDNGGYFENGIVIDSLSEDGSGFYASRTTSPGFYGSYPVTNAVNNGSGLVRLSLSARAPMLNTGATVTVSGVGGVPAANGTWVVTRINTDTFDLQGTAFAGSYTSGGTVLRAYQMSSLVNASLASYKDAAIVMGNFGTPGVSNQRLKFYNNAGPDGAKIYNSGTNSLTFVAGQSGLTKFRNETDSAPGEIEVGNLHTTTLSMTAVLFANLGTALTANGQMVYCSDCTIANPCAGGGGGAMAKKLGGGNVCN